MCKNNTLSHLSYTSRQNFVNISLHFEILRILRSLGEPTMIQKLVKSICIFTSLASAIANAAYYDTLPKGVRMIDYRNITTNNVRSSYSQTQANTPYSYEVNLNAELISELNPTAASLMNDLRAASPRAYQAFSAGDYSLSANADVNVQVLAFAYGFSDRFTVYAGVPFYKAQVNINYQQNKANNYEAVKRALHEDGRDDLVGLYESAIGQLFDVNAEFFQSLVVDQYKYKPVGTWSGSAYGDTEVGMIYQLLNLNYAGMAATLGANLPTGYVEDPSIIQDFSFGDGQTDIFVEVGGGVFLSDQLTLNTFIRYTYQMEGSRDIRVPEDEDFTLSDKTGTFNYKLGNKIDYNINAQYDYSDWLAFRSGYELAIQGETQFESQYTEANRILEKNTDIVAHNIRLGATISSLKLFQKGKFVLPGSIDLSYLKMISGKNTPKVDRVELQLRMFF